MSALTPRGICGFVAEDGEVGLDAEHAAPWRPGVSPDFARKPPWQRASVTPTKNLLNPEFVVAKTVEKSRLIQRMRVKFHLLPTVS